MGFFEKFRPKNFKEDKKIDEHIDFASLEKEPSLDDYTARLNNAADIEELTENPLLSKKLEHTDDTLWNKINKLKKEIEENQYLQNNKDPIFTAKINNLRDRVERLGRSLENTQDYKRRDDIYAHLLNTTQSLSRLIEREDSDSQELKQKIEELTDTLISIETIPTSSPNLN